MATLQDPTFGKLAFDYTDEERLTMEVANITMNTGDSNHDFFLSHVPEHVWAEIAEGFLVELYREARR